MSKATQLTLKKLRDAGYVVDVVERWLPRGKDRPFGNRHDAFGFADIMALHPKNGIVAVQSTTMNSFYKHRQDLLNNANARMWRMCGGRVLLVGWAKKQRRKKDGKATKAQYWTARWEEFRLRDFLSQEGGGAAETA